VDRGIDREKVEEVGLASELREWGCRRGCGGSPVSGGERERATKNGDQEE
jgi:hypothetical protein